MKRSPTETWPVPPGWETVITSWKTTLRARGLRDQTIHTRTLHIRSMARAMNQPPREITMQALTEWVGSQQWAANTRTSHYASLRQFFAHVWHEDTAQSPAQSLAPVRRPAGKPRPAPAAAIRQAVRDADERTQFLLRLTSEYGLRVGEAVLVHLRDIFPDLDGNSLLVHGKGGKDRYVPLTQEFATDLAAYCRRMGGGYAFPGNKAGHISSGWAGVLIRRAMSDTWSAHTLRHRFGTDAYATSRNILAVADLMGHSSPQTTRNYVQIPRAQLAQVIESTSLSKGPEEAEHEMNLPLTGGGTLTVRSRDFTVTGTDGISITVNVTPADLEALARTILTNISQSKGKAS